MTKEKLRRLELPDAPGVYTFRDARKKPLYIGRATSLRDRVRSYFSNDLIDTRGPRIVDMVTRAYTVTWQETKSVLEAVLLESSLIKRYQPFYNVDERDDKSSQYVVVTDEPWPRVFLARARDFDQAESEKRLPYEVKRIFGPFPESGLIKEALKILRKLFPFKDKKSLDPRHESFYRALGRSPDGEDERSRRRYGRTIDRLAMFFDGKRKTLVSGLRRQMKTHVKRLEFEDANDIKKLLYALDHINDIALIKRGSGGVSAPRGFRIEAYDIAHLSGMETVGAMTVSVDGELSNADYRRFKASKNRNDDIAGLTEILMRRLNHPEWPYPDLIVVDGNEVQKKHAEGVLRARRVGVPVVAVTKDERHKAAAIIGDEKLVRRYGREMIALNAEAHRFAIAYHRHRRDTIRP